MKKLIILVLFSTQFISCGLKSHVVKNNVKSVPKNSESILNCNLKLDQSYPEATALSSARIRQICHLTEDEFLQLIVNIE